MAVTIFCRIHSDFPAEKGRKIPGVVIAGQVCDLSDGILKRAQECFRIFQPLFRDIVVQVSPGRLFEQGTQVGKGNIHFGSEEGNCKIRIRIMLVNKLYCITIQSFGVISLLLMYNIQDIEIGAFYIISF